MPISSIPVNDRVEAFTASGGQTVFTYNFPIYAATDLEVRRFRAGVQTVLIYGTDFTVAGATDQAGGSITLAAPAAAGDLVVILSAQPLARTTLFETNGDLRAEVLNAELNRTWIAFQQLARSIGQALRLPASDPTSAAELPGVAARAGALLGFDMGGQPIPVAGTAGTTPVTPFMATVLDDATAAEARATLLISDRGGLRNLFDNPTFRVNVGNYASGAATTVANQYTIDRWRLPTSGQNLSFTTTAGVRTCTAPAGGMETVIEGQFIEGGTYTLTWEGTATATINGSAIANGGTVALTGGANCTVRFTGGTVTRPQLERGAYASPFERRPFALDSILCARYRRVYGRGLSGFAISSTLIGFNVNFDVPMRQAPVAQLLVTSWGIRRTSGNSVLPASLTVSDTTADITGASLVVQHGGTLTTGEPWSSIDSNVLSLSAEF